MTTTSLRGEYLGMALEIDEVDAIQRAYFEACAAGDFRLQRCRACSLLRYPPTTACPFCAEPASAWTSVEPRGVVYSYGEVHHAILPAFRAHVPYHVLLVELDEQRGRPTEHDALRVIGNLVTPDGALAPPELVRRVGIGSRVRMVLAKAGAQIAIPNWTLDESVPQPKAPWRYPRE
jgi:uncharacterized OB-fold protein